MVDKLANRISYRGQGLKKTVQSPIETFTLPIPLGMIGCGVSLSPIKGAKVLNQGTFKVASLV